MVVDRPPSEERADRLIDRLRDQDRREAAALVAAHYDRVHRYLARLLGDPATAEDLTQDTFLRAYEALPRLADDANLSGWLFRIATNLARKHYRRRRIICWTRLPHAESVHHPRQARALDDDVAAQDEVRRALDRLPLDQRACLLLYAWTGYTCAEIGQIMGRSPAAVRMLLMRARRQFRAAYGQGLLGTDGEPGADAAADGDAAGGAAPGRPGKDGKGGNQGSSGAAGGATGAADACQRVQEALPLVPRGDLPRDAFSRVTGHVRRCPRCRAALLDVQATYRRLQGYLATADPGSASRAAALLGRLRARAAVYERAPAEPGTAAVVPMLAPIREPAREPVVIVATPRGLK